MSEFGKRIRKRRKELDWSQDELAKHLSIKSGKQCISKWEQGRAEPSLTQIFAIAEAMSTTAAWLIGVLEPEKNIPEGYILIEKDKLLLMQMELINYQRNELQRQQS